MNREGVLNGWFPRVAKGELIRLVESVAASDAREYRDQIDNVAAFTRDRLVPLGPTMRAAVDQLNRRD